MFLLDWLDAYTLDTLINTSALASSRPQVDNYDILLTVAEEVVDMRGG